MSAERCAPDGRPTAMAVEGGAARATALHMRSQYDGAAEAPARSRVCSVVWIWAAMAASLSLSSAEKSATSIFSGRMEAGSLQSTRILG